MLHQSELGDFAGLLPCDQHQQLPEPGGDWRTMRWGLDSLDPRDAEVIE